MKPEIYPNVKSSSLGICHNTLQFMPKLNMEVGKIVFHFQRKSERKGGAKPAYKFFPNYEAKIAVIIAIRIAGAGSKPL